MNDVVGVGSLNQDLIYEVEGLEIAGMSFTPGASVVGIDLTVTKEDIVYANDSSIVHVTSFVSNSALKEQIRLIRSLDKSVLVSFDPGSTYARKGAERRSSDHRALRHHIEKKNGHVKKGIHILNLSLSLHLLRL
jgi:hypothetical protein